MQPLRSDAMGRGARARFAGWQVNKINLTSLGANLYTVAATLLLPSNVCGVWSQRPMAEMATLRHSIAQVRQLPKAPSRGSASHESRPGSGLYTRQCVKLIHCHHPHRYMSIGAPLPFRWHRYCQASPVRVDSVPNPARYSTWRAVHVPPEEQRANTSG